MPAAKVPITFRVDMLAGGLVETGGVTDVGLPLYPDMLCGGLIESSIENIGLPFYPDMLCGTLSESFAEVNAGTFTTVDLYVDMLAGGLLSVRGLIDHIEVPTFYLDYQAHLGGGLPSGLIGGSDEHSGS